MTTTLHDDADDLLHWLNAHSVSISDGIPFALMQQKWTATQRSVDQLRASLEWLFGQSLLAMTPGLGQPHIRLTPKGFEQLLSAMDRARAPAASAPALVATAPVAPAGSFRPAPLANADVAAAPPTAAAPSSAAASGTPPAAGLPPAGAGAAVPLRFVDPAKQPTEIGLRNQILAIFRDLKLQSGQQLIAMTLTRYWQEAGLRGEHLRAGLDVILRDGYVKPAFFRYENYWMLTDDGEAYLKAPVTLPALLALAQPLRQIEEGYRDADARRKVLGLFKKASSQPFTALESSWKHSRDALIHGLDLLVKAGDLTLSPTEPLRFELTPSGSANAR